MTIECWVLIGMVFAICALLTTFIFLYEGRFVGLVALLISIIVLLATFGDCKWYMSTASGKRALTDQKSNLNNGIERVVNVYTADGNLLAKKDG